MSALEPLETNLNDLFVKKGPVLPESAKNAIVDFLPWASLVVGVFTLLNVYWLWHWAHWANALVNYANTLNALYGTPTATVSRLTVMVWVGLIVLLVEGLLYVGAFFGTKDRKKSGWDLLFYALLVNVVYGVVMLFTSYNNVSNLLGTLVWFVVGGYFLFQVRSHYLKQPANSKKA